MILSSKCSSVYVDFENTRKLPENADSFGDNCVWTCCRSFSQLWQGYMWRVVNVLKNSPKTSNLTRRQNTQLNLSDINGTLAWKCSCADMRSISHQLTGGCLKGVLKQEFRGIQAAQFFGMNNFGHVEAIKAILFWKSSNGYVDFENAIKLWENVDGFEDNCVWTCCVSFCQLWQEYMWWALNVLKRDPKISDPTKRPDIEPSFFHINRTLA